MAEMIVVAAKKHLKLRGPDPLDLKVNKTKYATAFLATVCLHSSIYMYI